MNNDTYAGLPDVEAVFVFNTSRMSAVKDGYRPAHLIKDNYLTTGVHHYYDTGCVPPGGKAKGTIKFITPEIYPNSLWCGKKIQFQEGKKVVGYAIITKVLNPILLKQ